MRAGHERAGVIPVYAEAPGPGSRGIVLPLATEAQKICRQVVKLNRLDLLDRPACRQSV